MAREYHDETLPKDAHKVAYFCSMWRAEVLLDEDHAGCVDYAASLGRNEQGCAYPDVTAQVGMNEMSKKFKKMGGTKGVCRGGQGEGE